MFCPPRGRDLQRPLGDLLPLYLPEVGPTHGNSGFSGLGRAQHRRAFQMRQQRQQVRRRDHFDVTGPRRFCALRCGTDEAFALGRGQQGREEDAGRRSDPPVQL